MSLLLFSFVRFLCNWCLLLSFLTLLFSFSLGWLYFLCVGALGILSGPLCSSMSVYFVPRPREGVPAPVGPAGPGTPWVSLGPSQPARGPCPTQTPVSPASWARPRLTPGSGHSKHPSSCHLPTLPAIPSVWSAGLYLATFHAPRTPGGVEKPRPRPLETSSVSPELLKDSSVRLSVCAATCCPSAGLSSLRTKP